MCHQLVNQRPIMIIIQVSSAVVAARLREQPAPTTAYTASLELFCVIYAIQWLKQMYQLNSGKWTDKDIIFSPEQISMSYFYRRLTYLSFCCSAVEHWVYIFVSVFMLLVCCCGCAVVSYFLVFLPNKRKEDGKESTQFVLQRVNVSHKTMSIWSQCIRCSMQGGNLLMLLFDSVTDIIDSVLKENFTNNCVLLKLKRR